MRCWLCRGILALLTAVLLVGCLPREAPTPTLRTVTATPQPTVTSLPPVSPTRTPAPALLPDSIWVGVDGFTTQVAMLTPGGSVQPVALPLGEGEVASTLAATREALAYVVWGPPAEDGTRPQRGVVIWRLDPDSPAPGGPLPPEPGFRVVGLVFSQDGHTLGVLQVAVDDPAVWTLSALPVRAGDGFPLVTSADLPTGLPEPFAWPGPLLLNTPEGITAVDVERGTTLQLVPGPVESPSLSPDGVNLAYVEGGVPVVYNLREGEATPMPPPEGETVFSLRWADAGHLLLDVVEQGTGTQTWARAPLGQPPPWERSAPRPAQETLFDYAPSGEGVVYTLLPTSPGWQVYLLPRLAAEPTAVPLGALSSAEGAPTILYTP